MIQRIVSTVSGPKTTKAPEVAKQEAPSITEKTNSVVSPSPSKSPERPSELSAKDALPVFSAILVAVTVASFGVITTLLLKWKEEAVKGARIEKDAEVSKIKTELEAKLAERDDQIRDVSAEKDSNTRDKDFQIKSLETEIDRLKKESPKSVQESYEIFKQPIIEINEELLKELKAVKTELENKKRQLQELENLAVPEEQRRSIDLLSVETAGLKHQKAVFERLLETIKDFRERFKNYQAATEWLEMNRSRIANQSTIYIFNQYPDLTKIENINEPEAMQKFQANIDDYIDWLKFSLIEAKPLPLQKVDIKPILPATLYVEVFKFIQKEIVLRELPDKVSDEINPFVNDLITYFSSSASQQEKH